MVLGFQRMFTQVFLVSLMSSRRELLRVGLEGFDDLKWVHKLIKFHFYRSLYLTVLFELLKNLASEFLIGKTDDCLCVTNAGCYKFNLVITSMFIMRYCILLSVLDIQRSGKSDVAENDDFLYREQKKLWYILNFLPRFLPDEREVARIVSKHPDDFDQVEGELRTEFKKGYELFSVELDVMKKLKCRSVNASPMSKSIPFTLAIVYFLLQGIGWITIYITVLNSIEVQYALAVNNLVYVPALILYFVEMSLFPNIFLRIIQIDVLLDEKSAEALIKDTTLNNQSPRRPKKSEDFAAESEPMLSVSVG